MKIVIDFGNIHHILQKLFLQTFFKPVALFQECTNSIKLLNPAGTTIFIRSFIIP
jgi:hypothetical protein